MVVARLLFVVLIGLIGTAGCDGQPFPAARSRTTGTPAASDDSAAERRQTAAKEPASEAALPRAVAADRGPKPTSSSAWAGTANRTGIPDEAVGREASGQRQSRLFPQQGPDEGDQKRALLLFLLGVQQSRRAEAP